MNPLSSYFLSSFFSAYSLPADTIPQPLHKHPSSIKKLALAMTCLFLGCTAQAQVNLIQPGDGIEEYGRENAQPYDSLQNITTQSVSSLPGQTIFIQGAPNDGSGYYQMFFTGNFLRTQTDVFHDNKYQFTPANDVVGRYFTVERVWIKREQFGSACCLLLRDKADGTEIYCNPWGRSGAMTCMGYYEKMKKMHTSQTFYPLNITTKTIDGIRVMPQPETPYKCVDVGLVLHGGDMFLILQAPDGQKLRATPLGHQVYEFVSDDHIREMTARYGKKYGPAIAYRRIEEGMTADMVTEAMGEPHSKQVSKGSKTEQEYWDYGPDGNIILQHGKVVQIWGKRP